MPGLKVSLPINRYARLGYLLAEKNDVQPFFGVSIVRTAGLAWNFNQFRKI